MLLKLYGTKLVQTMGFIFIAISFIIIASIYNVCRNKYPNILYGVYCLLLFSLSGGPMLTTFILPSETFPKEIRTTFGGIASASGKLGMYMFIHTYILVHDMNIYVWVFTYIYLEIYLHKYAYRYILIYNP